MSILGIFGSVVVIYKKLRINLNPYQLYLSLDRNYENTFLLESLEGKERLCRFSFLGFEPKEMVSAKGKVVKAGNEELDAKEPIRALAERAPKIKLEREGFLGGAVGYFAYDYARNLENICTGHSDSLLPPHRAMLCDFVGTTLPRCNQPCHSA